MQTAEQLKESAAAGKAAQVLPGRGAGKETSGERGGTANGERGSDAHGEDGAQAEILTATGIASLLKSDLTEAGEEPNPKGKQTPDGEEPQQTPLPGGGNKPGTETETEPPKNPEAAKEVAAWQQVVADLEKQLEGAEGDESEALEKQLVDARKDLAEWQDLAGRADASQEATGPQVPEALQEAITEWETSGGGELPPALQKLVGKRIDKLTSQREQERTAREAAEARTATLESEVEALKANGAPGQASANGLPDLKQLELLERSGRRALADIEEVLAGAATEDEAKRVANLIGSERLDTPEAQRAIRQQKRDLEAGLASVPAERQRVQAFRSEEAKVAPIAKQWFPFLFDKADPDYQEAQAVLQVMPGLRTATPNHQIALGTYILGLRELRRLHPDAFPAGAAKGKPNGARPVLPRKAPVKSPASGGGAAAPSGARAKGREAEEVAARQRFEKSPTSKSVTELLKASLRS